MSSSSSLPLYYNAANAGQPQSFSSILPSSSSRRVVAGTLESLKLCPSMDLCVYHTTPTSRSSSSSSLAGTVEIPLYRTISWQRVATIRQDNDDDNDHHPDHHPPAASTSHTPTTCCWSPSGRWIAVAMGHKVHLYGVELLANPPEGFAGGGGAGATTTTTTVQHWLERGQRGGSSSIVQGLYWAHVGRAHPTAWKMSQEEVENALSWGYQSHFVDTTQFFLPPSGYLLPNDDDDDPHRHQDPTTTTALPDSQTPLSVLCVSTKTTIELYLHGRYPLLQLDSLAEPSHVALSHDLSYVLTASADHSVLSLFHLPFLKQDRYPLQIVASLHASMKAHVTTLQQTVVECANSWKTSLKPLDTKLQPLHRLLANYGVDDQPLGVILKQYILVGHTSESSSVANAIDQFFTGIQMNDQLLQRMERSLHSALANVESQARKGLLSPTQALCYQVQELAGHVRLHSNMGDPSEDFHNTALAATTALQELITATHQLWISLHALLVSIVQGRLRIRDFCAWLRSAGSQIKARGTALNSVQRDNAKNRRVPQAVLERLLGTINTQPMIETPAGTAGSSSSSSPSLSEHLLNLSTSTFLKDTATLIPLPTTTSEGSKRPESPASVLGMVNSTPTVAWAVKMTESALERAFHNPLSNIPRQIARQDIPIPASPILVLHMRVGADQLDDDALQEDDDDDDEAEKSYFLPRASTTESEKVRACYCRQWSVIATAQGNEILLHAIPLGWESSKDSSHSHDMVEEGKDPISYYLAAKLVLPSADSIRDIGFYSDDGKSSLSSGNDSGTGKEGHQKLGVLYEVDHGQLDLWLISYDCIRWQSVPLVGHALLDASRVEQFATVELSATWGHDDDRIFAPTRRIAAIGDKPDIKVKLMLCGSRGVGAIAMAADGVTSIELLDMEEDEEE